MNGETPLPVPLPTPSSWGEGDESKDGSWRDSPELLSRLAALNRLDFGRSKRSAQYGRRYLWRTHKVARRRDWFRSSIVVLFGDAAQAVFPLGRFILHYDARAPGAWALHSIRLRL